MVYDVGRSAVASRTAKPLVAGEAFHDTSWRVDAAVPSIMSANVENKTSSKPTRTHGPEVPSPRPDPST
jgi:hypothetical protein